MIDEAYQDLNALQSGHWWYVGARYVYRTLLSIGLEQYQHSVDAILDVGSGAGGNLSLLQDYGPTAGVELSLDALKLSDAPARLGMVCGSADHLPFSSDVFDIVTLFALIEHMEDDLATLSEASRVCKPDGIVVLLTSALPILWSHHDEANRHQRRYTKKELVRLHHLAGLTPLRISYQNFFTFPLTLIVRLAQRFRKSEPAYDMGLVRSGPINQFLILLLRLEAWLIRYLPLPIGVDLVAVSRPIKNKDQWAP